MGKLTTLTPEPTHSSPSASTTPARLSSNLTPPESLPHLLAELNSITVSSLLVTEPKTVPTTSSSRTLGVHHGVLKVTSRSLKPETLAVLPPSHLTQPSDLLNTESI